MLINVVSFLSILVIAGVTMSLVIIMSVFNGMENLIRSLYNSFDPQLKVVPYTGKTFQDSDSLKKYILETPGVALLSEVIEDNAVLSYKNESDVVKIKGVSKNFFNHHRLDSFLVDGELKLFQNDSTPQAIIGRGVQYKLMIGLNSPHHLVFYYPDRKKLSSLTSLETFNSGVIKPAGVFAIEKQYDDNYVFVPIEFARQLVQYDHELTSYEIKLTADANLKKVQKELKDKLGQGFKVLNSDEQHASLLKAIQTEKVVVNFMLGFILLLSSVGIFFCLTMLTLTKRKDIAILKTLGLSEKSIRWLFIIEGTFIAVTGSIIGTSLGVLICKIQEWYGIIPIGMSSSVVENYPVEVRSMDILSIVVWIMLISLISSIRPAFLAAKLDIKKHL
ncbi:MAG: FtsX-like permease family protein [Cytophagaceae bacterium]